MIWRLVFLLCVLASLILSAQADDSRPVFVQIRELPNNGYRVTWTVPATMPADNLPVIRLPEDCRTPGADIAHSYAGAALYTCQTSLAGREITLVYPRYRAPFSAMIRLRTVSGSERVGLLSPSEDAWQVPAAETAGSVARQYLGIGIEHILAGKDHLLFLACLIWIAGDLKRILITITGFTLSHSVTIALSALGVLDLPVAPVDAAIALSIVFLAREIALGRRESLTWNHPIAVSASFGLLHGLGFAAVLGDVGLPEEQLLTSLVFFNVGVEIGQLIFLGLAGLIVVTARTMIARFAEGEHRVLSVHHDRIQVAVAYMIGLVSTWWLIARISQFSPEGLI